MKYGLILSLLIAMPCMGQTKATGEAKTAGPCSPAVSGNNNRIIMNCQAPNKEKVEAPTFHEKKGVVSIEFGRNTIILDVERSRNVAIRPIQIGSYVPLTVKIHGDSLIFSFKLWSAANSPPMEVTNNEVNVSLPGWDWNYSANALEIVNEMKVPIFQWIRKGPMRIEVNGIFYAQGMLVVVSEKGMFTGKIPLGVIEKPIFKYPAWKYPGKYADGSN